MKSSLLTTYLLKYSPAQPRASDGKWTGSAGSQAATKVAHESSRVANEKSAIADKKWAVTGYVARREAYAAHKEAAASHTEAERVNRAEGNHFQALKHGVSASAHRLVARSYNRGRD